MSGARKGESRSLELVEFHVETREPDTRPVRRFHPSWMCCRAHNGSEQPIFVYGPRHPTDPTTMPTSLFLLNAGSSTPTRWDCKGILIPADCSAISGSTSIDGPVALKYRDLRRITIHVSGQQYRCPRNDGIRVPGQIDFAIPLSGYEELLSLPRRLVAV